MLNFLSNKKLLSLIPVFAFLFSAALQAQSGREWYDKGVEEQDNHRKVEYFTKALEEGLKDKWVYYQRGFAYYVLGKNEKAIGDFEAALAAEGNLDPSYLHSILGWTWFGLGEMTEAENSVNAALKANPKNTSAYRLKGWLNLEKENYTAAIADFGKYIGGEPDNYLGYSNRATAYYRAEDWKNTIADCDKLLELKPGYKYGIQLKAMAMMKMGKKEDGLALVREAVDYKDDDPISLSRVGNMFYRNGDYETAIEYHTAGINLYEKKIAEDPDFIEKYKEDVYNIYMSRGDAWEMLESYQHANQNYQRATAIDPSQTAAWLEIGELQTSLKNWRTAVTAYEKAYAIDPTEKVGWVNLGFSYGHLKEDRKAIDAYSRGIKNNPEVGLLYNNRGFTYLEQKQYEKALSDLQKAIQVEPEIVMSHVSLGEYYLEVGNTANAISKLTESLAMDNGSQSAYTAAYYKRGLAYFQEKKFEAAEDDLINATRLDRSHILAWELLGKAHYEQKEYCEAYKAFKRAVDLDSKNREREAKEAPLLLAKLTRNPCNDPKPEEK